MSEQTNQTGAANGKTLAFCHQCREQIEPKLPEFTCPLCDGGFVEDMTGNEPEEVDDPMVEPAQNHPISSLLESLLTHGMATEGIPGNTDSSSDEEMGATSRRRSRRSRHGLHRPGHRNRGRVVVPAAGGLDGLLHQILQNAMFPTGGELPRGVNISLNMGGAPGGGNPGDYVWGTEGLDNIITQLLNNIEGTGPPPCDEETLNTLPEVKIDASHIADKCDCAVCKELFALHESVRKLPCSHLFHLDCIKPWLVRHNTCPVCRAAVGEPAPAQNGPSDDQPGTSTGGGRGQPPTGFFTHLFPSYFT